MEISLGLGSSNPGVAYAYDSAYVGMMPSVAYASSAASGFPPRYTGKERDAESGNDYFGARYYASSMGRFLSPDWSAKAEPVPYAKLDNPQSLNLYAYVGNNPLSRVDPDGHVTCTGNKESCAQIKLGYDLVKAAQQKLGANSKEGKALGKVLAFYGAWGKDNGVHISAATLDKETLGATTAGPNGTTDIQVDLGQIKSGAQNSPVGGAFEWTVRAGVVAHEGQHGVDDKARGGGTDSRRALNATEHNAYRTESYVFQGFGSNSPYGLWNTGWSPGEAEANRAAAVDRNAASSVEEECKGGACKP